MDVSYFRARKQGPEIVLEDAVTRRLEHLAPSSDLPFWVASYPQIGAGMPDIVFACYEPEVLALSKTNFTNAQLLAFLRVVNGASLKVITQYLNCSERAIITHLAQLIEIDAVSKKKDVFSISPLWENIIPTIITIEVKVHDWRRAVAQAERNKLFSHQSYVALPKKVALKVKSNSLFFDSGVGLLTVDDNGEILIDISAPSKKPLIWEYYYKLATMLAKSKRTETNAIHRTHESSPETVS